MTGPDDEQFLRDFETMSRFGATGNGGVERQAASDADGEQRAWMASLLAIYGADVQYDEIGNQFGLFHLRPGAPFVLIGSHMDSQPTAGKYDGAYGVLAAAYVAARLTAQWRDEEQVPAYNLAVVNWFNEEGSRFKPSMMGSGVFAGKLELADMLAVEDIQGVSVLDALERLGQRGTAMHEPVAAYAEIHVEQGKGLEKDGLAIGVVEATWGANKYVLTVQGEQGHTGSTAMGDRKDALLGAALLVVAARQIAESFDDGMLHTSVGQMLIYPNSPVVVASEVTILLDLRSPSADMLAEADELLRRQITEAELNADVVVRQSTSHRWGVQPYTESGVLLAEQVAADLGLSHGRTMTLAGHDSTNMKDVVPTVFLFVPSVDGVSHNEAELTHDEDMLNGLRMLTETVRRMCDAALG